MAIGSLEKQVIANCQQSVTWFMSNFCKVKHPKAGLLPFHPFSYQRRALRCFREHRFNIFRKCRQAGASKIAGIYALWTGMFQPYKTVLIVSRRDEDAMSFLNDNVRLPFRNLPEWMQDLWDPSGYKDNEHEIAFPNGSKIKSLTSHPDVLRSNASSLNIIDEAAFIQNMDMLWAAGYPTLQHGGQVIVISTSNGTGNWYYNTWMEAVANTNKFNPISIDWWDMDWAIEYVDDVTGQHVRIAPTDDLRKCETAEDRDKYGDYWSPWLEEQYLGLQEKGESWKFEQEILARFIGSGNTVLSKHVLFHVGRTVEEPAEIITGPQHYVHPVSGEREVIDLTFPEEKEQGLWLWQRPVHATPNKVQGSVLIERGRPAHSYVMGVDLATGKGRDYQALEVFDVDDMIQVAECMCHCLPRDFKKIVDWVGRYYNCAMAVIERNNGGDSFIDEMRYDLMYPRLWRKRDIDDKPRSSNSNRIKLGTYGFFTNQSSKPVLNKYLIDFIRDKEGEGYTIRSRRLLKQMESYVRKKDKSGRDTGKTEAEDGPGNFDDLVMACALALVGAPDSVVVDAANLVPTMAANVAPAAVPDGWERKFIDLGGPDLLIPTAAKAELPPDESAMAELEKFAYELGGVPILRSDLQAVSYGRHYFDKPPKRR